MLLRSCNERQCRSQPKKIANSLACHGHSTVAEPYDAFSRDVGRSLGPCKPMRPPCPSAKAKAQEEGGVDPGPRRRSSGAGVEELQSKGPKYRAVKVEDFGSQFWLEVNIPVN